jgi:beta-galactosidase
MPNRFQIGVTYYPEHWPAENHARDLDRIKAAGFNVVRLGEGAWWYWEPREGEYQFELFDHVIDLCRERDIKVIMGTPTYCGPAWIATNYPDVLRANIDRVPMAHGSRRNYNYTSPKYLELSDRICTALATHYASEKQIAAWQLDNEFNCHMDVSYATSDTIAFRAWLREKYKSIDALNDAWGTRFWSQVYDAWDQLDLPHPTATYHNPTQLLDESRFISDCVVAFAERQAKILRDANPSWQITHNGLFPNVNGPDLCKTLDFFSHDHYPLFWKHWSDFSQKLIEARSLTFPFAIMEQQAGPGGQMSYLQRTPEPGELRLWTYQSVAHGADKVLYFTWRTCPFGSEQHWHGLIDADGADSRRLQEAADTARELVTLPDDFLDAAPVKHVAILRDFDVEVNERRINTYTHDGRWGHGRWAAAFVKAHVPTDFVWPDDDFEGYPLLIAGHLKVVDAALVSKLTRFVEQGGTLVLGAQSGLHDRNLHIHQQVPPGPLAELAGVEVEDWTTLEKGQTRRLTINRTEVTIDAFAFAERLRLTTATSSHGRWLADGLLRGSDAITGRRVGKGFVYYIGAYLESAATKTVARSLLLTGDESMMSENDQIECVVRESATHRYVLLLNHSAEPQRANGLTPDSIDLLSKVTVIDGSVELPAYGVACLAAPRVARQLQAT